ncbi:MAG: hypothetical protein JSR45_08575 [Proteobacteria bacterium]|nr:hypothetical protein [Pseudomonadota bacterium]
MKPILIAAAVIAVLGAIVGAASSHAPTRPMHDELRWSENSAAWTQPSGQPQHGANA